MGSTPKRYRKKPVVIEALKLESECDTTNREAVDEFLGGKWSLDGDSVIICSPAGDMRVDPGDFIIKGAQGEFYSCKPDIFEATHESADRAEGKG